MRSQKFDLIGFILNHSHLVVNVVGCHVQICLLRMNLVKEGAELPGFINKRFIVVLVAAILTDLLF